MTQEKLAESCIHLANLARQAAAWVEVAGNSDRVGQERKSILRMLRRSARRATRLGKLAGTRMSVSVFGPSQAGKSFLVSVLARPEGGRLAADFGGHELDYIREMNPGGEGESTGLVTRFTTAREGAGRLSNPPDAAVGSRSGARSGQQLLHGWRQVETGTRPGLHWCVA